MAETESNRESFRQKEDIKAKFPFTITTVDAETNDKILNDFKGQRDGFVQVGPKKYFFPRAFVEHADRLYNFKARADDIWIATHPRSGTTMTQELVWIIANNYDMKRARSERLAKRFSFFESGLLVHKGFKDEWMQSHCDNLAIQSGMDEEYAPIYQILANTKTRRFIKTHLPFSLMPPSAMETRAKIIYVARHPKDVAVSWYHFNRLFKPCGFVGDFSQFWDYFQRDLTFWSPYWEHIKEGWAHRDESNVLFLFYEDLIRDLPASILKIAAFLNKSVSDDDLKRLIEHLQFDNFRKNRAVNSEELVDWGLFSPKEAPFVRKGKTSADEWQEEYTPELAARAQAWIEKNLKESILRFPGLEDSK